MSEIFKELSGANMDIDLAGSSPWPQAPCPWNTAENSAAHRCAVKNVSICPYFCGIQHPDTVLCCYPRENPFKGQ